MLDLVHGLQARIKVICHQEASALQISSSLSSAPPILKVEQLPITCNKFVMTYAERKSRRIIKMVQ